ncbi:uncharacterized protein ARMOST_13901 [Armillaria ostoyae]|uniref:Uncharacterized protein n=1 Tax=Armillaria ostoyae TaxID=47428 RepID=A0A284RP77_ARMOS|nr:uncharacterized protein ARMOST_13901 [Armillaria ostoyae]
MKLELFLQAHHHHTIFPFNPTFEVWMVEISAPRYVVVLASYTGVAGSSALSNWCMLNSYGSDSGTSTSGCCGSCCDKSFNEDSFDEQVRSDLEATRDPNAPRPEQMQPAEKMTITSPKEAADKEDS